MCYKEVKTLDLLMEGQRDGSIIVKYGSLVLTKQGQLPNHSIPLEQICEDLRSIIERKIYFGQGCVVGGVHACGGQKLILLIQFLTEPRTHQLSRLSEEVPEFFPSSQCQDYKRMSLHLTRVLDPTSSPQAYMTITLPTEPSLPSPVSSFNGYIPKWSNVKYSDFCDNYLLSEGMKLSQFQSRWQLSSGKVKEHTS